MKNITVAVTGASGAGKSFFALQLLNAIRSLKPEVSASIVSEDSYYRDQANVEMEERVKVNYDHPDSLEHGLLVRHLQESRQGYSIEVPLYDYESHTRSEKTIQIPATEVLIVEGILLLTDPRLREEFDLSIFVHTPLDICLQRRLDRDCRERGRTEESVLAQFEATVKPMYHQYIEPSREHAELVIEGTASPEVSTEQILRDLRDRKLF